MGGELEFVFVGWSPEHYFIFVSMPCSWIFPSSMLSPRPPLLLFLFLVLVSSSYLFSSHFLSTREKKHFFNKDFQHWSSTYIKNMSE